MFHPDDFRRVDSDFRRIETLARRAMIVNAAISLALLAGIVFVAIHFLRKVW